MKRSVVLMATVWAFAALASTTHAQRYPADNSGKNVRDRYGATVTAEDQSNDKTDLAITQQIRRSVMADTALSVNAHNVKIITENGFVTLRGPVGSASEKAKIGKKAQRVAGVTRVDNELEIASH